MKKNFTQRIAICLTVLLLASSLNRLRAQDALTISHNGGFGQPPIPIAMDNVVGEAAEVLRFDLYVQGFKFVTPDQAKFIIRGSGGATVGGSLNEAVTHQLLFSRNYNGADARSLAHAFADDIVEAATGKKGIGRTQIAFKSQSADGTGEIYISDFDGHNAQAVTHDNVIVAAPCWAGNRMALYYNSYKLGNADIFYQNVSTGQRKVIARYGGSSISPAASPDGTKVAMILSKGGSPDLYVADADGTNLRQLTHTPEDESSPCWSPDGQWICFATKVHERRVLAKVSVNGGETQRIATVGAGSPSEPDWSPDGKYIAFTRQSGNFEICIVPAEGGEAVVLVSGEDPSWSPNSRTLIFNHSVHYRATLSVLDVFTKQVKDIRQVSGSNSEASWKR
jgi:TolB protein